MRRQPLRVRKRGQLSERPVTYYAVTRERGASWDASLPIREQEKWDEHAVFMNALVDEGFIRPRRPNRRRGEDPADHRCRKRARNRCPTRRRSLDAYRATAHCNGRALG